MTTVNTVPTAATRIGDFSNYRDRNGNLIPIYDPLTTRRRPGDRDAIVRDQFPNNIIPSGPHQSGRPEHREHLSAAEQRQRQLRQLHLDAQPRDHRQRVLRPRRSPAVGQRLVLRPVQLRQVQARRAAGPGELLPADACRGGRAIRSRPVRRRHPEHEADDARRRIQLLEGADAAPSSTSCASATPTPRRSRRSPTTATTPPNRSGFTASTSATSRRACRTSTSRTSPASPADRRSCRSTRSQFHYQIEDVLVWLKGRHQLKFGYRLVDRRPSPFIHDNTRSAINFGTSFVNNPLTNSGGTGLAEVLLGYFNSAARGFLLGSRDVQGDGAGDVRAGRLQGQQPADRQRRPALRDLQRADRRRTTASPTSTIESFRLVYAGENGASRSANKKTQYGNFAPRLGLTYKLTGDARDGAAHRFRHHLFPEPARGRQPQSPQRAVRRSRRTSAHETNPLDFVERADDRRSVPADCPGQAADDGGADCRQSPRARATASRTRRRTRSSGISASSGSCSRRMLLELEYVGSAGKHLVLCYNPNEVQPGSGIAGVAPAAAADRQRQQHAAVRSAQPVDLPRRHAEGAAAVHATACSSWSATPTASRSTTAARRRAAAAPSATGRRSRTWTPWHGPSGFDVRHRAVISYVYELPFGTGRRWMSEAGGCSARSSAAGSCRASRR